jgi:hypothetical protein
MMMSVLTKRVAFAGAAASVAALVGVFGIGGAGASPRATSHTLNFVAVTTNMSTPTKSGHFYEADVDAASGSTIAQDVLSCVGTATAIKCNVALANNQGLLYGSFKINTKNGAIAGAVTGGTGGFAGATGTIKGAAVSAGEGVTVTYST